MLESGMLGGVGERDVGERDVGEGVAGGCKQGAGMWVALGASVAAARCQRGRGWVLTHGCS